MTREKRRHSYAGSHTIFVCFLNIITLLLGVSVFGAPLPTYVSTYLVKTLDQTYNPPWTKDVN